MTRKGLDARLTKSRAVKSRLPASIYITRLFHFGREWSRNPICKFETRERRAIGVFEYNDSLSPPSPCPPPSNRDRARPFGRISRRRAHVRGVAVRRDGEIR